jgi:hypothetical protein
MAKRQKVLSVLNNHQPRVWTIDKQLYLPLSISNTINHIGSPMQPQNRTHDIWQASLETITITQVYSCHARTLSPRFTLIVLGDFVAPKLAHRGVAVVAETDVNQEIGKLVAGCKGRGGACLTPVVDDGRQVSGCVPAA